MRKPYMLFLMITLCIGWTTTAFALNSIRVETGFAQPVLVTHSPNDFERIFVVERVEARIKIFSLTGDSTYTLPFLDIDSLVHNSGGERGLLGLAFHPDYENNGYFFVFYTASDGDNTLARYSVSPSNPDSASVSSKLILFEIWDPYSNHNGGNLAFGPDGYLYIGTGDGGDADDPEERAQNPDSLLGKMLRIDVDNTDPGLNYAIPPSNPYYGGTSPRPEIWAMGMRNPWRWSFDRLTGDLYIGDVGQNLWEEVDVQPAASEGSENYGWDCMEGFACFANGACTCNDPSLTLPILNYSHGSGRCSVTGGFVYRGCAIPQIYGHYFYADYCSNTIWSIRWDGTDVLDSTNRTADLIPDVGSIANISSFGEDAYGEIYMCDITGGEIFKIVPDVLVDCNENLISDICDIQYGNSQDINGNTIPDECEVFPCDPVDNLTIFCENDSLHLYWTAEGFGNETYTVWKSGASSAGFPAEWEVAVTGLPFVAGINEMTYSEPISDPDEILFFVVTEVCP